MTSLRHDGMPCPSVRDCALQHTTTRYITPQRTIAHSSLQRRASVLRLGTRAKVNCHDSAHDLSWAFTVVSSMLAANNASTLYHR
eukprot:12340336-Alexandrium_andersonii.AAC.1